LFDDSDLNGKQTMKVVRSTLQSKGINSFVYREVAQTATDATGAALAMKGADIITSIGFPQTDGVFIKALGSVSYEGACGSYHSDAQHNLFHGVQILSGADGSEVATYTNMASS
jgi:hypothetical protein